MKQKLSIQRLFNLVVIALSSVVVIAYLSFSLLVFNPAYEQGDREAGNIMLSCQDSIESQFRVMSGVADALSNNDDVQKYLQLEDPYEILMMSNRINDLGTIMCDGNLQIRDVQLKDNTGRFRTVYGGSIDDKSFAPTAVSCGKNEFLLMQHKRSGRYTKCCYMRDVVSTKTDHTFGKVLGQIYVVMEVYDIQSLLNSLEISDDGFVALVDRDGKILMSGANNVGEIIDIKNQDYKTSDLSVTDYSLVITNKLNSATVRTVKVVSNLTIIMLIMLLGMILLVYWFFMRKFIRPVGKITEAMKQNTTFRERIDVVTNSELDIIVEGINGMLDRLEQLTKRIVSNQQKLYEMELLNQKSSIMALQNQTNPHFLYNTLECIRSIALVYKCKEISTISVSLAKIFRYSVQGNSLVTIEEELSIVREYMKIINIRFPEKIDIEYNVDEDMLKKTCYKMIMQPIVENSVRHGIEKIPGKGKLVVDVYTVDGDIHMKITDNGCGIGADTLSSIVERFEKSDVDITEHIGLYNVNKRIELQYGKPYGLIIESEVGSGTSVTIRMPDNEYNLPQKTEI